jgi:hypothetical protein
MIDAICDADTAPFYEQLGMARLVGLAHRNPQSRPLTTDR